VRGTRLPIVIFGPEGYGKSSLLKQGAEILRDQGFDVIYVDPLHRDFMAYTDVGDIVRLSRVDYILYLGRHVLATYAYYWHIYRG
jgi:predicted AAA+ superfamily ATPase